MIEIRPFDYDSFTPTGSGRAATSFTVTPSRRGKEKKEEEPTFTQDEVKKREELAFQNGVAEGHKKGIEEGKSQLFALEEQIRAGVNSLGASIDASVKKWQDDEQAARDAAYALAIALAKKAALEALDENGIAVIRAAIDRAWESVRLERMLDIRLHSSLTQLLEDYLKPLATRAPELKLTISADDSLQKGDLIAEWNHGGLAVSQQTRIAALNQLLDAFHLNHNNAGTAASTGL